MNPIISNISEEGDVYKFTLGGLNVSLANAVRRIILSEIPCVVIKTETYQDNQCNISVNTGRLHNEILKQRLSCIPIHMKMSDINVLPGNYTLEVDVNNETDNMMHVTTGHFKIKSKESGNFLTRDETIKIFPPNNKISSYIDFARLRPKISDSIPGERLKLSAEFSISKAKENSSFNVVSKCAYGNTPDLIKVNNIWEDREK
jgi:DNA-directed RNA polymerase alpha subunit